MRYKLFFDLLKLSVDSSTSLEYTPTLTDWQDAFTLAKAHALLGVLFDVIERLPEEHRSPRNITLEWFMCAQKIIQMNQMVNADAKKVCDMVRGDGHRC